MNVKTHNGIYNGKGQKYAIVAGRFNDFITKSLVGGGAVDTLVRHEVAESDIEVYQVPGAFEMPLMSKKIVESGKFDAVITLGAVIRGSTLILITYLLRWLRVLQKYHWIQVCLWFSVYSQQIQ